MSDPVPVLTDEERDAIENAWCISPQDGPEGPDDPMYRAVESILAARIAELVAYITFYIGDEYDKDGDLGLCDRLRALANEYDPKEEA